VQLGVRPARRPPLRDLVGDDDKAAAATHADAAAAAAAATDMAVPYLAVPAEAGRYAFPGVGVSGGSVHGILKFCEDFVFFFKFVKNLAYISLMSEIHKNNL